jgi:hypothetical protein
MAGVYLTDLTFIEDGIPSIIKKTNLINFAKRAKTAEVIRDIQQYQNVAYSLQPVPELQDYILSNMQAAGDVHEMYDKSLQIEPREREDEKIVRYAKFEADGQSSRFPIEGLDLATRGSLSALITAYGIMDQKSIPYPTNANTQLFQSLG